jgi:hypothetical protein
MREDDRLGHVVPLLRRTIVLVAVIIAAPVILWTITAFVRTYVGPPRVPTFRQLAATATINTASSIGTGPQAVAQLPQDTGGAGPVVEARATVSDARDGVGLKSDQTAEANPQGTVVASDPAGVFPPSPLGPPGGNGSTGALAAAQPAAGGDEGSDALSPATPLSGPIPLPRRRPRDIETRTADNGSDVPLPRRRPEGASSGAPADGSSGGSPLGFIQNIFTEGRR